LAAVLLGVAFWRPKARAGLALIPAFLVGIIGLYIAYRQSTNILPPVFEWPILFTRSVTPAWIAITLFAADALYEMVRRGRRPAGNATLEEPEPSLSHPASGDAAEPSRLE